MRHFCVLSTLLCIGVQAGVYQYHPSSVLRLGAGFNPLFPDRAYADCLDYGQVESIDGENAINTRYSMNVLTSRKQLFESMGISASMSARGSFWSASGSVDYLKEHKFHKDNINWMVMGTTQFGRFGISDVKLKKGSKKLLEEKKYGEFEARCGSEFVQMESRRVMVSAIFTIENVSEEDKEKLETQFEGSISGFLGEGEMKAKYTSFYNAASHVSRVRMTILAVGGAGIQRFGAIIKNPGNLEEIQSVLAAYLEELNLDAAVPSTYLTGSMSVFGWDGTTPISVYRRERALGELFHAYRDVEDIIKRIRGILELRGALIYGGLSEDQFDGYEEALDGYQAYRKSILNAADGCYENLEDCDVPDGKPERVVWPINLVAPCEKLRLKAYRAQAITEVDVERMRLHNQAPIMKGDSKVGAVVFCSDEVVG